MKLVMAKEAFAAALAVNMRTPLASVELVASQLEREAATPTTRRLAARVSEAVSELDGLIDRLLAVLIPPGVAADCVNDLGPVLERTRERLAPVLAARGVSWETPVPSPARIAGDPEQFRRLIAAMLRPAAAVAGVGGRISLSVEVAWERAGLTLHCERGQPGAVAADQDAMFEEARALAFGVGGALELEHRPDGIDAVLCLPQTAESCDAF